MECKKCQIRYNNKSNLPRILTCGHTFCETCLNIIQEQTLIINCLTCFKQTKSNIQDLIINFSLIQEETEESLAKNLNKNSIRNQEEIDDFEGRHSLPFLNQNSNKKKSSISFEDPFNNISPDEENCEIHNKPFCLFCDQDNMKICATCIVEKKHEGHNLKELDKVFNENKSQISLNHNLINSLEEKFKENLNFLAKEKFDLKNSNEKLIALYENSTNFFIEKIKIFLVENKKRLKNKLNSQLEIKEDLINQIENIMKNDFDNFKENLKKGNFIKKISYKNILRLKLINENSEVSKENLKFFFEDFYSKKISDEENFIKKFSEKIIEEENSYINILLKEFDFFLKKSSKLFFVEEKVIKENKICENNNNPFEEIRESTKMQFDIKNYESENVDQLEKIIDDKYKYKDSENNFDLDKSLKLQLEEKDEEKEENNISILSSNNEGINLNKSEDENESDIGDNNNENNKIYESFYMKESLPYDYNREPKRCTMKFKSRYNVDELMSDFSIGNNENLPQIEENNYEDDNNITDGIPKENQIDNSNKINQKNKILNKNNPNDKTHKRNLTSGNINFNVNTQSNNNIENKTSKKQIKTINNINNNNNINNKRKQSALQNLNISGKIFDTTKSLSKSKSKSRSNSDSSRNLTSRTAKTTKASSKPYTNYALAQNARKNIQNNNANSNREKNNLTKSSNNNSYNKIKTSSTSKRFSTKDFTLLNKSNQKDNKDNKDKKELNISVVSNSPFEISPQKKDAKNQDLNIDITSPFLLEEKSITNNDNNFQDDVGRMSFNYCDNLPDSPSLTFDRFSLFVPKKQKILVFGGKPEFYTFCFDFEKSTWEKIEDLKIRRTDFQIINISPNEVLVIGGKNYSFNQKENITDLVDLINMKDFSKSKFDVRLRTPKYNFCSCLLEIDVDQKMNLKKEKIQIIFIAGGFNGIEVLNSFEYYDSSLKNWVQLPNMPTRRKEFCLILSDTGLLYFIGGVNEKDQTLKSVDVYDLKKNVWTKVADMNEPRKGFGGILMPDGIYVFGGVFKNELLRSCERFNFSDGKWEYIQEMIEPRSYFICIRSLDLMYIYAIGGYNKKNRSDCERLIFLVFFYFIY